MRPLRRTRLGSLLFEEVLEGLAGVHGTRGSGGFDGDLRGLHIGGGSGVFFHGGAKFVELASVLGVFGSDAGRDGLGTFKLDAAVEKTALLAAMQLKIALGTFTVGIEAGNEDRSTIGAAGAGDGADHARGARAEMIGGTARTALRGLAIGLIFLLLAVLPFGVAIAAVTVLAIHKCLRPSVLTDCNYTRYNSDSSILFVM